MNSPRERQRKTEIGYNQRDTFRDKGILRGIEIYILENVLQFAPYIFTIRIRLALERKVSGVKKLSFSLTLSLPSLSNYRRRK